MTFFDANSAGTGSHCTSVCPPLPITCSSCSWSLITEDDEGRQNEGLRKKQKLFFLIPWPTQTHNTVHLEEDSFTTLTQLLSTPALFLHSTRVRPSSPKSCLEKIFGNNKILIKISHRKALPLINWLPLINNTPVEGIFLTKPDMNLQVVTVLCGTIHHVQCPCSPDFLPQCCSTQSVHYNINNNNINTIFVIIIIVLQY